MRSVVLVLLSLALPSLALAQRIDERPEGIVETHRDVDVELVHGMALVTTRIGLRSESGTPREVRVRVPAPAGALVGLRVCSGRTCRDGAPRDSSAYEVGRVGRAFSPEPVAIARMVRGWRMDELEVEAAPVVRGRDFEITVRYATSTGVVEGVVTLLLPPQDSDDPSDPQVTIEAHAADLEDPRVDGEAGRRARPIVTDGTRRPMCGPDPRDARITARLPSGAARALAWSTRCGNERCVRYRVAAGTVPPRARDVVVLLDASPSSRGVSEETRRAALDALLASLAPDARVTRIAYAREAVLLDETPRAPADVPRDLALPALGNRTLFERAWALARDRVRGGVDPLIAIVGDGAIATTSEAHVAIDELIASGAQLALIQLARREGAQIIRDAIERTLGVLVDAEALDAQASIHAIAMPVVDPDVRIGGRSLGPLRAGQDRVVEETLEEGGPTPALIAFGRTIRPTSPPGREWQTALARRRGHPHDVLVAVSSEQVAAARTNRVASRGAGLDPRFPRRIARVPRIHAGCGWGTLVRGSVSREALMRVRRRLDPALRQCFRDARQGRPEWSATVMLRLVTSYGELIQVGVPSTTDPSLGACLVDAIERFEDIPFSDGVVAANFRFVAEPHPPSTQAAPLAPEVQAVLEAIHVE
jgi:hypothetical protein